MPDRTDVIKELRALFKDGATFSGLLHYLQTRHNGAPLDHWTIRDYLQEAFALPIVRYVEPAEGPHLSPDRLAVLNRTLLPRSSHAELGCRMRRRNPRAPGWTG